MSRSIRNLRPALCATLATLAFGSAAAAADLQRGKTLFEQRCGICHGTAPGTGPIVGPNLAGILGRKAATVADFKMYTPALQGSGLTWNKATLDQFLANPMSKVPGTAMPMPVPDTGERADIIEFLATLKGK